MSETDSIAAILIALGSLLFFVLAIGLIALIVYIVGLVKLYKKAGKEGWEAIVPFYSQWIYTEIADLNWWWFLFLIAPTIASIISRNGRLESLASLVILFGYFVCNYNIAKKFHKDTGTAILMTIFPFIMIPVMAFSNSYQYDDSVPVSKNGVFGGTPTKVTKKEDTEDKEHCKNCGAKIYPESKYCVNCGKEIK